MPTKNHITPLPCPFCGTDAELKYDGGNEVWGQSWQVQCMNPECHGHGPKIGGSNSWATNKQQDNEAIRTAITEWNKRAP